jgi:hypothetical protein
VNFHSVTVARDDASRVAAHWEKGVAGLRIDSRVSGPFHLTNSIHHAARATGRARGGIVVAPSRDAQEDLPALRAVVLAKNEIVMKEMERW